VASRNAEASTTANNAWHTASVWVRAEAQVAILDSTMNTIIIECACSWFGLLVFTGDFSLAFLVLGLVIVNISGLAFFMISVMHWAFGPIEIIFVLVFLGYSVTFGLHMAHNYSQVQEKDPQLHKVERHIGLKARRSRSCSKSSHDDPEMGKEEPEPDAILQTPAEFRKARTRMAVLRVGGAILSSTVSTIGSSIFLCLCTLTLFVKLGLIVIAVTVLSIVFTLFVLPAVLMLLGPPAEPCHMRFLRRLRHFVRRHNNKSEPLITGELLDEA